MSADGRCQRCGKPIAGDWTLCPACVREELEAQGEEDNLPIPKPPLAVPEKLDPRCHVCTSQYRRAIERLAIMPNMSYTDIGTMFDIDRRSVSNHINKHLNYEEAAIRRVIEHEAQQMEVNAEEGVRGALTRRVFLNVYIQRTTEALLNGELELTGKDAMAAIQMLEVSENKTEGAALDEYRLQFSAFTQAMREICSPEQWYAIVERTKQLVENPDSPAQLGP